MVARFYVQAPIAGSRTRMEGPEAHHMVKVLRMGRGEEVILFDGEGTEYLARIEAVAGNSVELAVISRTRVKREAPVDVTVCVAVPKGERMEQLIRGCSELGAGRIVPLLTERSVVTGGAAGSAKLVRWRRVAVEASKQSGRTSVCDVSASLAFDDAIAETGRHDLSLFGAGSGPHPFVTEAFAGWDVAGAILLFIGPEGGFTTRECDRLERASAVGVTMGSTILRVETAAVAMLAMVLCGTRRR